MYIKFELATRSRFLTLSQIFFSSSFLSFNLLLSAPKTQKRKALDENSPYLERENRDKKWWLLWWKRPRSRRNPTGSRVINPIPRREFRYVSFTRALRRLSWSNFFREKEMWRRREVFSSVGRRNARLRRVKEGYRDVNAWNECFCVHFNRHLEMLCMRAPLFYAFKARDFPSLFSSPRSPLSSWSKSLSQNRSF